jgi:hypothetical protein
MKLITAATRPGQIATLLSILSVLPPALLAETVGADAGYPGTKPSPFTIDTTQGRIVASNNVLSAEWETSPAGLRMTGLRDQVTGTSLLLTGEVFQIVLTNGQRYPASALAPSGPARVSELRGDPRASRLAARLSAQQVELPLRSTDGRLDVVWRALATDGANYVRQQIAVRALGQDCPVREIVWCQNHLGLARTAGLVDGSPLVAGNFFLGSEDPHAANGLAKSARVVANWVPADLASGKVARKTWVLDAAALHAGVNEFVFQYRRGSHRLDVWRTALLENGREVAQDEHHGHTGTSQSLNVFRLSLPALTPAARYELAAELSTDPDFRLPAGQRLESYGEVTLLGAGGEAHCALARGVPLRAGETLAQSFVAGVAPAGQLRRGFLYYLERERGHPYRPYLHYNSWYDISWPGFAMNESNCLAAIRVFGEQFIKPYGVTMQGMVFDDGWDDAKTLWHFHSGFPDGFSQMAALCQEYHTRLGVWLSPFGGYGDAREQRLKFGSSQGFETNPTGFSLAGSKYYQAFKDACLTMMRRYGVNHFKFDGIASGMYANGPGAGYLLDTEAMRRLMLELREEDPSVYINLTTGSWPSPFWLLFADSVWRQGGDMGFSGKGNRQQQWITYRDQEVCHNIVGKGPLYPLNALMTQGVAWSRHGSAAERDFDSRGFRDDVRGFFGSGTSLQELYIQPQRLGGEDWRVLAEAAKWSQANAGVLVDTHWIGGDPGRLEVYGYAAWTPRKATVMLRNPDVNPRTFPFDAERAFELPPGAARRYVLKSPWAEDAGQPVKVAEAGRVLELTLKPFEVLVLEAAPQE